MSDKKRKKSSDTAAIKLLKEDVYGTVINFEELESQKRSADEDSSLFFKTCDDLRKIMAEVALLKKENTDKAKQEIIDKRIEGSLLFVLLKKLNRLDKVRIRAGRDTLHKEKLRVDSNRLQLQNLLYEADHLKKEVQRCYQFKSQDEEIDLVSIDEFYKNAPETVSKPEKTKNDEHARRLARLEWELDQRKELSVLCKSLQSKKEIITQNINAKTERLDSLEPHLQDLLKATRPLQMALQMEFESEWEIDRLARLLPRPLYLLYANISAYADACDKINVGSYTKDSLITTTINGNEDEAKQLEEGEKDVRDITEDITHDSDNEDNDNELRSKKSHHHRRQSKSMVLEQKKHNLFKPHPLSVNITIKIPNYNNISLQVVVMFLPTLGFVTAKCTLNGIDYIEGNHVASEIITSDTILNCLFPEDFGQESPCLKTNYQLKNVSLDPNKLIEYLDERDLGRPYKWAQEMCGLKFIALKLPEVEISSLTETSQTYVPGVIKQIRFRLLARFELYKQIKELAEKNINDELSVAVPNETNLGKLNSSLTKWSSITWETYRKAEVTQIFIDANAITQHDLFYHAIVIRAKAKLDCFIGISCNFPNDSPLWAIKLHFHGIHNAQNNSSIREMEYWINSLEDPKQSSIILNNQLKRAMSSFDIYLETESQLHKPVEFFQHKTFLRPFRGRQRSRPFKSIENGSGIVYTQI